MAARLWVALDVGSRDAVEKLLMQLGSHRHVKVGMELFFRLGLEFVRDLVGRGYHVFLDLKCHDIPRTVGQAVAALRNLGVEVVTVHASGGLSMLEAARQEAGTMDVVAVTVLTSLDTAQVSQLGITTPVHALVEHAVKMARQAGLAGVVAAGSDVSQIHALWPGARIVVPGIRFLEDELGDQRRVTDPVEAVEAGATDLVVGRPIIMASDPAIALNRFLQAISK